MEPPVDDVELVARNLKIEEFTNDIHNCVIMNENNETISCHFMASNELIPSADIPFDNGITINNVQGEVDETSLINNSFQKDVFPKIKIDVKKFSNLNVSEIPNVHVNNLSPSVKLQSVDDFIDELIFYRCKLCAYINVNKDFVIEHFMSTHVEKRPVQLPPPPSTEENPVVKKLPEKSEIKKRKKAKSKNTKKPATTKTILPKSPFIENLMLMNEALTSEISNQKKNIRKNYSKTKITPERKLKIEPKTELPSPKEIETTIIEENPPEKIKPPVKGAYKPKKEKVVKRPHKPHRCLIGGCNATFSETSFLETHKRCHAVENSAALSCFECNTTFKAWGPLSGHIWASHNIDTGLYSCPLCEYRTYSLCRMNTIHILTHGTVKAFVCDLCPKSFKNRKQLRNHRENTHKKNNKKPPEKHVCPICQGTYADIRVLRFHIDATHNKTRRYLCRFCGAQMSTQSAMKIHERKHMGLRPHCCTLCSFCSSDHNSLRRHMLTHGGRKPYKCPLCNYSCIQSATLKEHVRNKHPNSDKKVFSTCTHCPYRTINFKNLLTHMSTLHKISAEDLKKFIEETSQMQLSKNLAVNNQIVASDSDNESDSKIETNEDDLSIEDCLVDSSSVRKNRAKKMYLTNDPLLCSGLDGILEVSKKESK